MILYSPTQIAECGGPCQQGPEHCDCGALTQSQPQPIQKQHVDATTPRCYPRKEFTFPKMLTAIRDFSRSVSRDVERFLQALRTIERLPALLAENHNALLRQMSALTQILSGIEFLISENASLKAALGESGLANSALQAELAAAAERYQTLVSEEVAEDELETRILGRLAEVLPQPPVADTPADPEPVADAPVDEPVADEDPEA